MTVIKEELEKAPSLEPYEFKAWDDEARDFVNSILRQYLNPGSAMDEIVNNKKASSSKAAAKAPAPAASDDFDMDFGTNESSAPVASANESSDSGDDLDAFLNDLDL